MSDDVTPEHEAARRERLSRERLLLLADMDPTEFRRPASPVFTEPAEDLSVTDDLKPHMGPARPDEETSR